MNIPREDRKKIYPHLPEDVKEAFSSPKNAEFILDTGEAYNLSEDEQDRLGEAVGLVLLGILSMKEFQEHMHEKIDGPAKQINKLVREVQEEIFQPIAGSLKKLDPEAILAQAEAGEEEGEELVGREEEDRKPGLDIPVPPPPGGGSDTPTPSYGGTSDPYREPVDN